jgi:Rps23 Pro-64 3,4-dihydroxylase Tpa1-like proline 4-hydroxylase
MDTNLDPLITDTNLLRQAEQRCTRQLSADPENRAMLRSLAELYRKLANLEEAAALCGRLSRLDPNDQEAAYLHALLSGAPTPITPTGCRPTPFVWIKNFLPRDFHESLIPFAGSVREQFVPSRVGRHAEYKPDVRQTLEFWGKWPELPRFKDYLAEILPNVLPRLHLPAFAIEKYTIRLRAYLDGHFFRIHQDTEPDGPNANRVVNFVYYFHRQPRPYSGGDLLLFDSDVEANTFTRARFTRVIPEDNSIILFPCCFYHSVVPVRCPSQEFTDSRFVVNGHISKRVPGAVLAVESVENPAVIRES